MFTGADCFEKIDGNGNVRKWLVPSAQKFEMEPLLVTIQPHQEIENDKQHSGEEFGYVLSGRIRVHFGDKSSLVRQGESFYYRTTKTHYISNPAARPAKLLWISTPPEF